MKLNNLFSNPLGANIAPIGLNKKCDALGAFGLVGSIFSGMMQSADVSATNEANLWQTVMTNEANQKINEQQLAWAREQYEQEKAENRFLVDQAYERELENREHNEQYNSPAALAARYRAAGINPTLAMYGGAGGVGSSHSSINAQTGNNPHANQPNMIPMQNPSANIPTGFGSMMVDILQNMAETDIKRDALNEQISARVQQNEMDYMKLIDDLSSNKVQREYLREQISDMHRKFALESDKLALQKDWNNFQKYVQQYQLEQHDKENEISAYLANSKINLDSATVSELAQSVLKMKREVFEMARKGESEEHINHWIAKQQELTFKNMELDWKRRNPDNYSKFGREWNDFSNWLVNPIRGIVSIGIK